MLVKNYLKNIDFLCVRKWKVFYHNEQSLFYDVSTDEFLKDDFEIKKDFIKQYGKLKIISVLVFGTTDSSEVCFYLND